jgi:hypothetical protein
MAMRDVGEDAALGCLVDELPVLHVQDGDSSGLRAFLGVSQRAKTNGHRLILIGASPSVRRLFALTRTEFLLDEQDAASTLGRFTGKHRPGDPMEFAVADADG